MSKIILYQEKGALLIITLELTPEIEAKLRAEIMRRDAKGMRRVLADAFAPTVERLLQQTSGELSDDEFELMADQLAEALAGRVTPDSPALSDYAVSRAEIYEDHP